MPNHFIAKLTADGGPQPEDEIEALIAEANANERGHVHLGTRKVGSGWTFAPDAFAIVFSSRPDGTLNGVVGRIILRRVGPPSPLPALYAPHADVMKGWWTLKGICRFRDNVTLADIPGQSSTGHLAVETFKERPSFAYWSFDDDPTSALS